jgi:hypothetical protein
MHSFLFQSTRVHSFKLQKKTAKSLINCMMKEEENRKTEGANQ